MKMSLTYALVCSNIVLLGVLWLGGNVLSAKNRKCKELQKIIKDQAQRIVILSDYTRKGENIDAWKDTERKKEPSEIIADVLAANNERMRNSSTK